MFRALYTAATGMTAQELNLDVISNNLANASTTGFRRSRLQFQDLLYQQVVVPGSASTQQTVSAGLQIGSGARSASTEILQNQGNFMNTGNTLDLVIQGKGFFQIKMPDGSTGYTRDGSFHLDQNGNIVTSNGNALDPAITIPANATNISIGTDGTVSVTLPGQTQTSQVGTIQLANFANPGGLIGTGQNIFTATEASGTAVVGTPGGSDGIGSIQQGFIEQSNVDVVEEFVQMIMTQRAYESNSKVVQAANQMYQQMNQVTQ